MKNPDNLLVTTPDSPYRILGANYDGDARSIQVAFRQFFKKNPKEGIKIGKPASQKLTNPKERVKADALCCQVPMPHVSLAPLKTHLENCRTDLKMLLNAISHPVLLSDLFFPEQLAGDLSVGIELGELEYRGRHEREQE